MFEIRNLERSDWRKILVAVLVLPLMSVTSAMADSAEWDLLVKAAQAEGQLEVVLAGQMPLKLRRVLPAFQEKYGVKVNFHTGGGRQLAARMLAERKAGRYTLDVRIGGANTALVQLLPAKALARLDALLVDPEVTDQSLWFKGKHHYSDPEGRYIFTWGASPSYQFSFNTKLVDPNSIKSHWDMLDPKWKGKIVSWSPAEQGTAASSVPMFLHPKIGERWFRKFASEMDVTFVRDPRQGAEWVALGRYAIGMFGLGTQAVSLAKQGFPIQGYLPQTLAEGTILSASAANLMVMDKSPHPNATKLFVNWVLTREAQQLFIKAGETTDSLRTDVNNAVIAEQYRIYPDREYIVAFSDPDYINRQKETLGQLRQIMRDAGNR